MEIREISRKSTPSLVCQGNVILFAMSENTGEICPFQMTSENGATYLANHFTPLRHNLLCAAYIVTRSKEHRRLSASNMMM